MNPPSPIDPMPDGHWEEEDPLIESLLDEALSGRKPPDLSARILARLQSVQLPGCRAASGDDEPAPPHVTVTRLTNRLPNIRRSAATHQHNTRRTRRSVLLSTTVVILLAAATFGIWGFAGRPPAVHTPTQLAQQVREDRSRVSGLQRPERRRDKTSPARSEGPSLPRPQNTPELDDDGQLGSPPQSSPVATHPSTSTLDPQLSTLNPQPSTLSPPEPTSDTAIIAQVDEHLEKLWQRYGVAPAEPIDDRSWCRRTFRHLLGREPSAEEIEWFLAQRAPERRTRLVRRLMNDEPCVAQWSHHWAGLWTDWFMGASHHEAEELKAMRQGLQQYLHEAFHHGKSWSQIVTELVSAEGSNDPDQANYNGATNFLLAMWDDRLTRPARAVGHNLLGQQLGCAQCHDHPYAPLRQQQFWSFAACFAGMRRQNIGSSGYYVLSEQRFGTASALPQVYYELPNGVLKGARPALLDDATIHITSGEPALHLRRELSLSIARSDGWSRAVVNRAWQYFFRTGLARPSHSVARDEQVAHPELLQYLASQFRAHGSDLRELCGWIVLSRPFALAEDSTAESQSTTQQAVSGYVPLFNAYWGDRQRESPERRLTLVGRLRGIVPGSSARIEQSLAQILEPRPTQAPAQEPSIGTVEERLDHVASQLEAQNRDSWLSDYCGKLAASSLAQDQLVEHIFWASAARSPTLRERAMAIQLIQSWPRDRESILREIWWAVVTSDSD